jgi:hypothetical protein
MADRQRASLREIKVEKKKNRTPCTGEVEGVGGGVLA